MGRYATLADHLHLTCPDAKLTTSPAHVCDHIATAPATNVDIAPTLLTLAGVNIPTDTIDGRSFVSFLLPYADEPDVPGYLRPTLQSEIQLRKAGWRESVFIHHYRVGAGSYCGTGHHIDQEDNNFIAVRHLPGSKYGNVLYAECKNLCC